MKPTVFPASWHWRRWLRAAIAPRTVTATLFVLAGCNASDSLYGGGGGGGGGPAGQVTVGNNFFQSAHNGSQNPAVDTVTAGSTVTWTWREGGTEHNVQSTGSPSFTSSALLSARNATYPVTYNTPGTYTYNCVIHGSAMTGRIIVQ